MDELTEEEKYRITIDTCQHIYEHPSDDLIFICTYLTSICVSKNFTEDESSDFMNKLSQSVLKTFKEIKEKKDV